MRRRNGTIAILVAALTLWVQACSSPQNSDASAAEHDAVAFLARYVLPSGRVVRADQGGDTVSEGQAYAMLVAVAIGDRKSFSRIWAWTQQHLQQPDGLLAWHWADGKVVSTEAASDADIDAAWALAVADRRFDADAYLVQARRLAQAAATTETVRSRRSGTILVAGPWAVGGGGTTPRTPAPVVAPGYWALPAMLTLANTLRDPAWNQIDVTSAGLLDDLTRHGRQLPADWAEINVGTPVPSGVPGTKASPSFGLSADRALVWMDTSCIHDQMVIAASLGPELSDGPRTGTISTTLTGQPASTAVSPVPIIAAAAAADAGHHDALRDQLLAQAGQIAAAHPTYYGDAWMALGRILLTTTDLAACP